MKTARSLVFAFLASFSFLTSNTQAFAQAAAADPPPRIISVQPPAGEITALTNITVTFSEPVTGLAAQDLTVNNVPVSQVSGSGANYTFSFEQPAYGPVVIEWVDGHVIRDSAGNAFDHHAPGAAWTYTLVDRSAPQSTLIVPAPGATVQSLLQVEVRFNEIVTGVDPEDLLINQVPARNFRQQADGSYLFEFPAATQGAVQVSWSGNAGIRDLAGNAFAGGSWSYTVDPTSPTATVVINEFLSSNDVGLRDEDNEWQDWIELRNVGTTAVNLEGWSLTDELDEPSKWTFPATNLAPGQLLVVFASGKDRKTGPRLHTNFKLNVDGDYLALFDASSPRRAQTEFRPDYPEQRADISYGLDSSGAWKYFSVPSPGTNNAGATLSGVVPRPNVNVPRGLFDTPFKLIVSSPLPGVELRYTTNGSRPTATNALLTGPMDIQTTTVLKVAGFREGMLPSRTETHTYIFPRQVLTQPNNPPGYPVGATAWKGYPSDYEMDPEIVTNVLYKDIIEDALKVYPVVSIVANISDFFDSTRGIYVNPLSRGPQWERPISMEWINQDGSRGFQVDAGIQIQGNAAREPQKQPKHPMRVVFKGDYGPATLQEKIFPDSPVTRFDTLILRADFNNSWLHWNGPQRGRGQRVRDAWMKDSMRAMGGLASHNRYVHLYLNGLYWGIYEPAERPDGSFGEAYLGGQKEDYDVVNEGAAVDGNMVAYNAMLAITGLNQPANYERMKTYLDMTQFIDYMLLHFYAGHNDWGLNKNWYTIRSRVPAGPFKYNPWDGEIILEDPTFNRVTNTDVPSGLHTSARLLASPEYRLAFADRAFKHLTNSGALTPEKVTERWQKRAADMNLAIVAESARWGDYRRDVHRFQDPPYEFYTRNVQYSNEQRRLMTNYFPRRTGNLITQLRTAGLWRTNLPPTFSLSEGMVSRGSTLTMTAPAGAIHYTLDGSDPRVAYTDAVSATALTYKGETVVITNSTIVKARTLISTNWSPLAEAVYTVNEFLPTIRVTEVMYNPQGGDPYEFIEFINTGALALDLTGYSLDGVDFLFPAGTVLPPGGLAVVRSDLSPNAFTNRYPSVKPAGAFRGALANGGELLVLRDPKGQIVLQVDYDDENGWPAEADGAGYSLELSSLQQSENSPANWKASATLGGTPGAYTPASGLPNVHLSEVYASGSTNSTVDFVELANAGASAVNLGGWTLRDGNTGNSFVFPANAQIAAQGFLVVSLDGLTNAAGLHAPFALNREGDGLFLYNSAGTRVDAVTFGSQISNRSISRDAAGSWRLSTLTPNAANQLASTAAQSNLRLNEWLAWPMPGEDTWIELHNTAGAGPVSLDGLIFETPSQNFIVRALSFVEPSGFVQIRTDGKDEPGHALFTLDRAGGQVALRDADGVLVDSIAYTTHAAARSEGRFPDGASAIQKFAGFPTPAAPNSTAVYNGALLSEIMARNISAHTNSAGQFADWIELHNPTAAAVDLSGMSLSIDQYAPGQWRFPSGTAIPAGGYLAVWGDGTSPASVAASPALNTGRSIDGNNGAVYLFSPSGQLVDFVTFGFQIDNLTIGRSPAGWALLSAPTPGAANASPATLGSPGNLRINEWLANSINGDDWFEIYNAGSLPVSLQGVSLTDDLSLTGKSKYLGASLSYIAAKGWIQVLADDGDGANHATFNLNESGEALRIYDPVGVIVDSVEFGPQAINTSEGRLPDGGSTISALAAPSPAAPNHTVTPDADSDAIPDEWERTYNLDPRSAADASQDPDQDGQTNLQEYISGTDPRNPASRLRIDALEIQSGRVIVRFTAQAGREYVLQYKQNLSAPWTDLRTFPPQQTASQLQFDHLPVAERSAGFYRCVILRNP